MRKLTQTPPKVGSGIQLSVRLFNYISWGVSS